MRKDEKVYRRQDVPTENARLERQHEHQQMQTDDLIWWKFEHEYETDRDHVHSSLRKASSPSLGPSHRNNQRKRQNNNNYPE